jgi:integration host factor subunit alpha
MDAPISRLCITSIYEEGAKSALPRAGQIASSVRIHLLLEVLLAIGSLCLGQQQRVARMAEEKSTVTKADIVEKVYQKIGFSKKEASELVEMVFNQLKDTLCEGEKVKISGFGNFVVRSKKERVGRNPQTGDQIKISARRVLTFRPSQVLKAILNGEDTANIVEDDND